MIHVIHYFDPEEQANSTALYASAFGFDEELSAGYIEWDTIESAIHFPSEGAAHAAIAGTHHPVAEVVPLPC